MKRILISIGLIISCLTGYSQVFVSDGGGSSNIDEAAVAIQIGASLDTFAISVDVLPSGIDTIMGIRNDTIYIMPISAITAPLQAQIDSQGNLLSIIYDFLAAQGNDLQAPTLDSIVLGGQGPSDYIFRLYFNEQLNQDSVPSHLDFTVTENGNAFNLTSSGVDSNMVTVSGATPAYGNNYLLSYAKGDTAIQDTAGNKVANWTGHTVVNRLPEPIINMISNGDFTNGTTDWSIVGNTNWVVEDGTLTYDGGGSYVTAGQISADMVIPITPSTSYTLTLKLTSSSPGIWFRIQSADAVIYLAGTNYVSAGGTVTIHFTTPDSVGQGGLSFAAYGDAAATIDDIVLTED